VNLESLDRTVCWTPVGGAGFEHLQLRAEDGGYVARSIVLGIDEDETPFRLQYKIKTDQAWHARKVWVRAATPFTNALPINRLRLTPGQSADIRVVYVTAPNLDISVSAQRYSRRGQESDIFFESPTHDFTALLPIDGDGLVLDYPQLFRRAYPL